MLSCKGRPNLLLLDEEVENAAQLIVPSLGGHEVVKASYLVKWRYRATPIGGDAVAWMADQEGKMKLLQDLRRHYSRIPRLGLSVIRIRGFVVPIRVPVTVAIGMSVCHTVRPDALLRTFAAERW